MHSRWITVFSPFVNILLRWTFSVTPIRNLPVNKRLKFWLKSVYRKFFINVHKNLFAPQTLDLLEKLALIFLYNFHRDHILLTLKIKKLSLKINVKNIKTRDVRNFSSAQSKNEIEKWPLIILVLCIWIFEIINIYYRTLEKVILLDFSLTVKAAPHECVIRTSQP